MIGRTLLHYQVTGKLGEGGMGEVYRATDQKLGRDVAIKVLPEAFAADAERLARFEREAKLLAGLNHPNIAAIYGIEAAENERFLVLEFVEGEDLAEKLKRGPVPVAEALDVARQMTTALEVAHEQGIVHRDLKPANILIKNDGVVKVLDFGLAKASDPATDQSNPEFTQSPTVLHSSPTMAGVILGTAAYMSPEQARGKVVDKRADVFAFGAVLFEMLTGEIAFSGETVSDTLAAVLKEDPDYNRLPTNTPRRLRALLERCLEKDVKRRLRDIGEARIALEDIDAGKTDAPDADTLPATKKPSAVTRALPWMIAAVAALFAAWSLMQGRASSPRPMVVVTSNLVAPDGVSFDLSRPNMALSPDGNKLAFVGVDTDGVNRLYVRQFDTGNTRVLEGTESARTPFWSPDSRHIAFQTGVHLMRVDLNGGDTRIITAINGDDGTWSAEDIIVFSGGGRMLYKVSASGGAAEPLDITVGNIFNGAEFPQFLPDNRHLIFSLSSHAGDTKAGIYLGSLDSKDCIQLTEGTTNARYAAGYLLYMQGDHLVARSYDVETQKVGEAVHLIVSRVQTMSFPYAGFFFCADNGALTYVEGVESAGLAEMVWVDRSGTQLQTTGLVGDLYNPRLSNDERRLGLDMSTPETHGDIWVYDLARRSTRRLTAHPVDESVPTWSPDDSQLYFFRGSELDRIAVNGGEPTKVFGDTSITLLRPTDVSPDGRFVICGLLTLKSPFRELAVWDTEAGALTQFTSIEAIAGDAQFSPDGNWVVYFSNESGEREVYVERFPDRSERFKVSEGGGFRPRWRGDGRELFYVTPAGEMMSVPVDMDATDSAPIGEPVVLFSARIRYGDYDVTADGQRFIITKRLDPESTKSLMLVSNWPGRIADAESNP